MTKNTYGTGCFMLQNTGTRAVPSSNRLVTTIAWRIGDTTEYALEGSVFVGGAVVQWLRDGLGLIRKSEEVEALAKSVPDNGGVYFVPAFVGLGAPHWDSYARGSIFGLTRGTDGRSHRPRRRRKYRLSGRRSARRHARDSGNPVQELRVDGGAAANDGLMQFQADILGVPVVRPAVTETTAMGAAYLAGSRRGFWTRDRSSRTREQDRRFEPNMPTSQARSSTRPLERGRFPFESLAAQCVKVFQAQTLLLVPEHGAFRDRRQRECDRISAAHSLHRLHLSEKWQEESLRPWISP